MRIEIWSDYTCPFCYIGKTNFEKALSEFAYSQYVNVKFYSYQLEKEAKYEEGTTMQEVLFARYRDEKEALTRIKRIEEEAASVGLSLNLEDIYHALTYDVHRLTKLAKQEGKEKEFIDLVFERYFNDGYHLGDKATLKTLASELALDEEHVDETLSLNCFNKSVEDDMALAEELGIDSVPFFIINDQYAIVGAQSVHTFLETLEEVWETEGSNTKKLEKVGADTKSYCTGEDCEL